MELTNPDKFLEAIIEQAKKGASGASPKLNIDSSSSIKDKVEACRDYFGKPGAWAFEHEGKFYCEYGNPECSLPETKTITRSLRTSGQNPESVTEQYHVCGVRKIEGVENGRERR